MKRILAVLAVLGIWVAVAAPSEMSNMLTAKEKSEGWTLLFDGKTLNGWTRTGKAEWSVKDGAIALRSDDNGNLFTNDTYDNFQLKLEFRTTPDVNSGVFLRYTPAQPNAKKEGGGMPGYEVQIRENDKRALEGFCRGFRHRKPGRGFEGGPSPDPRRPMEPVRHHRTGGSLRNRLQREDNS